MLAQFQGEKHGQFLWVFDTEIHRRSKYSKKDFFDKLQGVEAIRCNSTFELSWYIRTDEEWALWDVAWNIANKQNFDGMDFVTVHPFVFGLSFPQSLLNWLRSVRLEEMKDIVIQAMRSLYMKSIKLGDLDSLVDRKHGKTDIMERQIWRPIRDYVCIEEDPIQDGLWLRNQFVEWRKESEDIAENGYASEFDLQLRLCYFRKDDWEKVITKGELDALRRQEAREDVWQHWRYSFVKSGINFTNTNRRKNIPSKQRFRILQRDGFKCQLCGANREDGARLEIDHKVAVSNCGTNDDENLWTLCKNCNSGKGTQTILS